MGGERHGNIIDVWGCAVGSTLPSWRAVASSSKLSS